MTNEEFVRKQALHCPNCDSTDITDTDYYWAGQHLVSSQRCDSCHAEWNVECRIETFCDLETEEN